MGFAGLPSARMPAACGPSEGLKAPRDSLQEYLLDLIKENGSRKELHRFEEQQGSSAREEAEQASGPREDFSADCVLSEESGFEVWLGSLDDALSLEALRRRKVNAFLNCAVEECERECATFRSPVSGRRRCHARGMSAMSGGFEPADPVDGCIRLDRDQVRSLALFDGEWYASMLGYETSYLGFAADDDPRYSMERHFSEASGFLRQCRAEGRKVLVHCIMGINRSTAALVAFLCGDLEMSLEAAIDMISRERGHVLSNASFLDELITSFGSKGGDVAPSTASTAASGGTVGET